jgi:asparagine synthase (glutamine-hydrolysing)
MCGISGFVDGSLNSNEASAAISRMLESISHRGPDARETWIESPVVFGHNRLSIIDLSKDGNQPMHYKDTVIVFNGEIYNYIEVRDELEKAGYVFKTQSDTEVILVAYEAWGRDCVKKFIGMWAFALWDKKRRELFCSRDRFGIKPFYYIFSDGKFYFGSEYKALQQSPVFNNQININQVGRGLQMGWICYDNETYFECIQSLPAACNLVLENDKLNLEKYWSIDTITKFKGDDLEKQERFRSLFLDSIKLHMRADVEVGGCLSGGLDSSSIASAVSVLYPSTEFKTFTIYYDGKGDVDERPWANEVLKKYPTLKDYTFSPGDEEISEHFEKALYHADVPVTGSSPFSQYFVMQLAAQKKIKVLLDGQGSDEYLAGYMHSFYRLVGGLLSEWKSGTAIKEFNAHSNLQKFTIAKKTNAFAKSILAGVSSEQSLYELEYKKYFPFVMNDRRVNFHLNDVRGSRLNRFLYHLTTTTSLPSLLHFEDRNSMAFSIESRVPFLDHRLVEFAFSLQDSDKIKSGETKYILRKSLRGIVPDNILDRKDKKGFVTPGEIKWLRGPLNHLLDADFKNADFLDRSKVLSVIRDFRDGNDKNANLVWRLVILDKWMKLNKL